MHGCQSKSATYWNYTIPVIATTGLPVLRTTLGQVAIIWQNSQHLVSSIIFFTFNYDQSIFINRTVAWQLKFQVLTILKMTALSHDDKSCFCKILRLKCSKKVYPILHGGHWTVSSPLGSSSTDRLWLTDCRQGTAWQNQLCCCNLQLLVLVQPGAARAVVTRNQGL